MTLQTVCVQPCLAKLLDRVPCQHFSKYRLFRNSGKNVLME